jgi:phosphoglycerate dehydrogenase-like enzyme
VDDAATADPVLLPNSPPVVLGTDPGGILADAVARAAPVSGPDAGAASGLIWAGGPASGLEAALARFPAASWVQLPSAGIEEYDELIRSRPGLEWTCAKGIYGASVGEHALALVLALRRGFPEHAVASAWDRDVRVEPLFGSGDVVTVLGGGGIAVRFAELIAPFLVHVRVVRRRPTAGFAGPEAEVVGEDRLAEALTGARVLVITLPATEATRGLVGERELRLLAPGAVVVNVGRGSVLDQDALLRLLEEGHLSGAGLDVTDPEPLPAGHPLWSQPRCLVTSHTSNPPAWRRARLAELVQENTRRFLAGQALLGRIQGAEGY